MKLKDILLIKENIKKDVNDVDPWYLLESGAPDDEYNSYVDKITSFLINKKPNKLELGLELRKIFQTNEFEIEVDVINDLTERIGRIKV